MQTRDDEIVVPLSIDECAEHQRHDYKVGVPHESCSRTRKLSHKDEINWQCEVG